MVTGRDKLGLLVVLTGVGVPSPAWGAALTSHATGQPSAT